MAMQVTKAPRFTSCDSAVPSVSRKQDKIGCGIDAIDVLHIFRFWGTSVVGRSTRDVYILRPIFV